MRAPGPKLARAIIALATMFAGTLLVSSASARAQASTGAQSEGQTGGQTEVQAGIQTGTQTITVRLLNGKSGKPMRDRSVRVEFQGSPQKSTLTADKHGNATLTLPPGATAVSLIAATRGTNSTQPAYTVCGPFGQFLPIKDILARGFVPQDACSATLHLTARPGELLYLIEPLPWYNPALQ